MAKLRIDNQTQKQILCPNVNIGKNGENLILKSRVFLTYLFQNKKPHSLAEWGFLYIKLSEIT